MALSRFMMPLVEAVEVAPLCGQYFVVDIEATERPTTLINLGDLCFCKDMNKLYRCTQLTPSVVWTDCGGAGGGSGTFSISQAEIDFGATPVTEAIFTVTDAAVTATMKLIGNLAYVAPTGRDLDEVEMEPMQLEFAAGAGEFTVHVRPLDGPVEGKYKIHYTFA